MYINKCSIIWNQLITRMQGIHAPHKWPLEHLISYSGNKLFPASRQSIGERLGPLILTSERIIRPILIKCSMCFCVGCWIYSSHMTLIRQVLLESSSKSFSRLREVEIERESESMGKSMIRKNNAKHFLFVIKN